jgi:hypothetical protein
MTAWLVAHGAAVEQKKGPALEAAGTSQSLRQPLLPRATSSGVWVAPGCRFPSWKRGGIYHGSSGIGRAGRTGSFRLQLWPAATAGGGGAPSEGSGGISAAIGGSTQTTGGATGEGGGGTSPGSGGSDNTGGASAGSGGSESTGGTTAGDAGSLNTGGATAGSGGSVNTGGSDNTGGAPPGDGICGAQPGQLFGSDHPFNQRIDQAELDSESDMIINYLQQNHNASEKFRIDGPSDQVDNQYGIVILTADDSAPHESFNTTGDFWTPDCDPAPIPVPAVGAIEGEAGYACDGDGDCHLIVIDTDECRLHEMWRADRTSASDFDGGCQAVWDLSAPYTETLRGDCCTSADAAGLPIAAHMVTADEIATGEIRHALRFILPNPLIRERIYVRPATHSTGSTTGPAEAPPYGVRMRLRASFDDSGLNPAARIVATALKQYGMLLSDGGNLTFTFANDRFTTAKWRDVGLGPGDLASLEWTDFEVVELGERFTWDAACNCSRTPVTE